MAPANLPSGFSTTDSSLGLTVLEPSSESSNLGLVYKNLDWQVARAGASYVCWHRVAFRVDEPG
jgi:hypothetical protein